MPRQRQRAKNDERTDQDASSRDDGKRFAGAGPRPFWSGTITFGLVSLPVNLYPANRAKPVSLRMVDQEGTPLARRYFCEKEGRVLENSELIRGYEVEKNTFVVVEDRELEELAPEKSQEIDLKRFVGLDEIDPMYFQRAYFLTPDKGVTKAYRLLAQSMEASGRAGIATFVMRGKEYLVAIIAEKGILRAETLRFDEEVRAPEDIDLPDAQRPDKQRVKAFEKAIDSLTDNALPQDALEDKHSQKILAHVQDKLERGEDVIGAEEAPDVEDEPGGEVVDLMQVLKQSLAKGRPPSGAPPSSQDRKGSESKRPPKKKTAAASAPSRKTQAKPVSTGNSTSKSKSKSRTSSTSDLTSLSKTELYERAQKLSVSGRSQMSKAELIEAIKNEA
ncbi:Ku protein [Litchfieldella xinjiangensis]|uniref:non-homologous end joining protein Ku n=1 Tax=Litchfieldella xinjiangensis TaxID=1166948 RepID=UPI0005BA7309|nr:Ku protein [Halomonas xinjiangensis]